MSKTIDLDSIIDKIPNGMIILRALDTVEIKKIKEAMTEACKQILSIAAEEAKIDPAQSHFQSFNKGVELKVKIDKSSITDCIKYVK